MFNDPDMMPKERRNLEGSRGGRRRSDARQTFESPFGSPYIPLFSGYGVPPKRLGSNYNAQRYSPQNYQQRGSMRGSSPRCLKPRFPSSSAQPFNNPPNQYCYQNNSNFNPYCNRTKMYSNKDHFSSARGDSFGKRPGRFNPRSGNTEGNVFDVKDYIIPAMTADPWATLKKKFFEERQKYEQHVEGNS